MLEKLTPLTLTSKIDYVKWIISMPAFYLHDMARVNFRYKH